MSFLKLSPAESEIMDVLWKGGAKTNRELLAYLNTDGREWKRQTLNTLLTRLEMKDLVAKKGHIFAAKYTPEEYHQLQAHSVLTAMYEGSLANFVTALTGGAQLSEEEAANLQKYLKEKGAEKY